MLSWGLSFVISGLEASGKAWMKVFICIPLAKQSWQQRSVWIHCRFPFSSLISLFSFPSLSLSQSFLHPRPPNCMFFLFLPLKKKKNQQQNQNENQSRQTLNKKKKKINWQEIIKQNKKLPENGACVVFTGACTGVWLIFSVMPPWSKLIFPFPAGVSYKYLLSQGQDFPHFLSFFVWLRAGIFVSFEPMRACLMYIVTVLCVHPVASGRQQFLGVLHHIWLLQFSLFLFCIIPEPWGDNVGKDFPFSTDYSKVPCSLHVIWLWSPLLTAIYSKKKRLWRGLNNVLLLGTAVCH